MMRIELVDLKYGTEVVIGNRLGGHTQRRVRAWMSEEYDGLIEFEVASGRWSNVLTDWEVEFTGSFRTDDCANFMNDADRRGCTHTCGFGGAKRSRSFQR